MLARSKFGRTRKIIVELTPPLILFECGPSGAKTFGREPVDLYDLLTQEMGYDVFFLKSWLEGSKAVAREEFERALVYPFQAFNWIAKHRS